MKDTVINGTGNSRSIKSAPTIPATWEEARALLISSGWPIDLGGLNKAGCQQIGDALNKANLLKDATAALYGLTGTAVPDEVLAAIRLLITQAQNTADGKAKIAFGSYTGNGSTSKSLTFGFAPRLVFVTENGGNRSFNHQFIFDNAYGITEALSKRYYLTLSWNSNGLIWTTSSSDVTAVAALNTSSQKYCYAAIG